MHMEPRNPFSVPKQTFCVCVLVVCASLGVSQENTDFESKDNTSDFEEALMTIVDARTSFHSELKQNFPELHQIVTSKEWTELEGIDRYLQVFPVFANRLDGYSSDALDPVRKLKSNFSAEFLEQIHTQFDSIVSALLVGQSARSTSRGMLKHAGQFLESTLGEHTGKPIESPLKLYVNCIEDNIRENETCELTTLNSFHTDLEGTNSQQPELSLNGKATPNDPASIERGLFGEIKSRSSLVLKDLAKCVTLLHGEMADCLSNETTNQRSIQNESMDP